MSSIIEGYEYDIFISYRQKDNKGDMWVSEFVDALRTELESTFKEDISVYFDINPHDGLLETHDVDASLKEKLKCLVFIPIISRTYCDPKSFAWEHEFKAFVEQASKDKIGLKLKIPNGNVVNRILPVRIHDLDPEDIKLCESVIGGILRGIEFIYREPGVNKPLTSDDDEKKNLNNTKYKIQINKVANAVKEIISASRQPSKLNEEIKNEIPKQVLGTKKENKTKFIVGSIIALVIIILCLIFLPKLSKSEEPRDKSIAVLPFVNLSNDPEQEYFSNGIVEAILNQLFKVGDLRVISATTTKRYKNTELSLKEIAKELGVSTILEGSVQKSGYNIRITAQLIDAKTDIHLWSEIYDKELSDIFLIQSEVAQNVARELKATLTLNETHKLQNASLTRNELAYDFYLKGNDYWSKFQPEIAISMYSKALQEDSIFAAAYARRAQMHAYCYWQKFEGWQFHGTQAKADLKKGFELNSESPEVKFGEAVNYYMLDRDYDKALKILDELKGNANSMADLYAYSSYVLRRQGKLQESITELNHALQLDPLNANYLDNLIQTYQKLHKYDEQIELAKKSLSLIPDYINFNYLLYEAYLNKTGDLEASISESGQNEQNIAIEIYYYRRQYDKLIKHILKDTTYAISYSTNSLRAAYGKQASSATITSNQNIYDPKTFFLSWIYYLAGNKSLSKIYADSCISTLNQKLEETPDDERLYITLGKCYALLGNVNKAIEYGQKVVNIMPMDKDATLGIQYEQQLMEIYILTGNYDIALQRIEYLLTVPSYLDIGKLKIDPRFDNLRSLPRFQKIIDSAQKKLAVK